MRLMFIAVIAGTGTGAGVAQTTPAVSDYVVESSATVVSDYRFRGYSLSNEEPALQLETTVTANSGFYAGAFASTIAEYGVDADEDGAKVEVDFFAGWTIPLAGFDIDVSALAYLYPDASDVNYYVLPISISRAFGSFSVTAGYEYTPAQQSLAAVDGSYGWLVVDWASERLPLSLTASVGREDGVWASEGKTDWALGADYTIHHVQFSVSYTDADTVDAGSAVVAGLGFHF